MWMDSFPFLTKRRNVKRKNKANLLNTYKYFELLLTEILKQVTGTYLGFIDDLLGYSNL